jgi:hypothetical protein
MKGRRHQKRTHQRKDHTMRHPREKLMLTRNFERLQPEVTAHVAADRVAQGSYETCFIGCLANGQGDPGRIENEYGIPLMVTHIAESIFEGLPADEAIKFFAALPEAVGSDGKDLTRLGWKFLATELRALPPVPDDIQACIDPVIEGMDLLADGKEWPKADAARATDAALSAAIAADADWSAANTAWYVRATYATANAAADAAHAASRAAASAAASAATDAAHAATAIATAAWSSAVANANGNADANLWFATSTARLRQRDTLLGLIKKAPITQEEIRLGRTWATIKPAL